MSLTRKEVQGLGFGALRRALEGLGPSSFSVFKAVRF